MVIMVNNQDTNLDEIKCPNCGTAIPVTEALRHQLSERIQAEFKQKNDLREKDLAKREAQLATDAEAIDKRVQSELQHERTKLEASAKKQAEDAVSTEVKDMRAQLLEKQSKLEQAEKDELAFRKRERELEAKERNVALETEKRIAAERHKIEDEMAKSMQEEHRLKDAEKDKKLQDAIKANEELRRKLQQGSQQTQGEVLELELEEMIRTSFPSDTIDPVPKGVSGADVIQRVVNMRGESCGIIVWESKHAKAWQESWIPKLKDDLRLVKGDIAILVTEVLPKDVKNFTQIVGVWVTSSQCALGLALAVRGQLVEVAMTKLAAVGKNEKMEILYRYLSGSEFKQRVEAIVEGFVDMQKDLHAERRATELRWSRREKQIQKVIANTVGMHGDLSGLMGPSLQSIPALTGGEDDGTTVTELPALEINKDEEPETEA